MFSGKKKSREDQDSNESEKEENLDDSQQSSKRSSRAVNRIRKRQNTQNIQSANMLESSVMESKNKRRIEQEAEQFSRNRLNMSSSQISSSALNQRGNPRLKEDKIIQKSNLERILLRKNQKYGMQNKLTPELYAYINNGLTTYMKTIVENLVKISRTRHINLNLYSKLSERAQVLPINTYTLAKPRSEGSSSMNVVEGKPFSIMFTRTMKEEIDNIDKYEELNSCKVKYEKISNLKSKIEEIEANKEKEKSKQPSTVQNRPKLRRRENQMSKMCKKVIEKTKKKEEINRRKKETKDTLQYILDDKPRIRDNLSFGRNESEVLSNLNESQVLENYTKQSDRSDNILQENASLDLLTYTSYTPSENQKANYGIKRKIVVKDLMFYLEKNPEVPGRTLLLHKALVKLSQFGNSI